MRKAERALRYLTDVQTSMILSHLAGKGALCCDDGAASGARYTIARDAGEAEEIREWAYDTLGCGWDEASMQASSIDWPASYLAKAENQLSGLGPWVVAVYKEQS